MVYFNEPHVFIGIEKQDCIVKFVRFLIENNYCY